MISLFNTLTAPAPVLAQLDLDGFLLSEEFLSIVAGLFTAIFSGLANAFLVNAFGGAS